ncbi:MAG TPA: (2Fe-2S)-binding protein [Polyangia bacterium]
MLVCHCHQVSDRTIRACIRDGAETVAQVGERCRAGTGCGGCRPTVKELISALGGLRQLVVQLPDYEEARSGPVASELGK